MTIKPRRVAFFGGSFDPPHVGHLLVVAYVLATADVDEVWVVPAHSHPLDKAGFAPFEDRVRMCELAFADLRRTTICTIEAELSGPSRTLHTLEEILARHPNVALRLVLGSDLMNEVPRWHRFETICDLAPPIIVGRGGYDASDRSAIDIPAVSSSDIRRRIADGRSVEGLLPTTVAEFIAETHTYRAEHRR